MPHQMNNRIARAILGLLVVQLTSTVAWAAPPQARFIMDVFGDDEVGQDCVAPCFVFFDAQTTTDAGATGGGTEDGAGDTAGAVAKAATEPAKWAVPATLSGVVLYSLIAAGGGAKGTPETTPISAQ